MTFTTQGQSWFKLIEEIKSHKGVLRRRQQQIQQ